MQYKRWVWVLLLGLVLPPAQAGERAISEFLKSSFGLVYQPSFFAKAEWSCPSERLDHPSGNITRSWVCERRDPKFNKTIAWHLNERAATRLREDVFQRMAGGKDAEYGETRCSTQSQRIPGAKNSGEILDCSVQLANGVFYASFFQVEHRGLGLTLHVRNASPTGSTPEVAGVLRQWLTEISLSEEGGEN